jgi:hypothetical protein
MRRWAARLAWFGGVGLFGCGSHANDVPDDASGPIIMVPGEGGFRIPDFACDGGADGRDVLGPSDGSHDASGCAPSNPGVRFQTDVLPVFRGCSGELCHAPWSYGTTVGVMSTECCDRRPIVDPGHPDDSYLVQKIRGVDLCGNSSKMGDVPPDVIRSIEDWICLGAPDN